MSTFVDELLENFPGRSFIEKARALVSTFADARVSSLEDRELVAFVYAAQDVQRARFRSREQAASSLRELIAKAPAPLVYVVGTNTLERAR